MQVACSQNGTDNLCTGHYLNIGGQCLTFSYSGGTPFAPAVWGAHDAGLSARDGQHGCDVFQTTLKNGWFFYSYYCDTASNNPGDGRNRAGVNPATFPSGQSNMRLEVDWKIDWCDGIVYACPVWIKGPMGVPWRPATSGTSTVEACSW